jgi:hypothetical protein
MPPGERALWRILTWLPAANMLLSLFGLALGCGASTPPEEVAPETRALYRDLLVDVDDCRAPAPAGLSRQSALADIDVLERVLRRGYAGFEIAGDEARWAEAFRGMRADVPDGPTTPLAFRDALLERLRFADDNHLGLSLRNGDSERNWRGTSGHAHAFYGDVELTREADAFVDEDGARLVACGERSADEVARPFAGDEPSEIVYRPLVLSRDPRITEITCAFDDGTGPSERTVTLARIDIADDPGPIFERRPAPLPWLRVRSLATSYRGALNRFVGTATAVRGAPVIVLDVRRQAGGSDRFLLRWFKALTSEGLPYFRTRTLESEVTLQGAFNFWHCIAHNSTSADDGGREWLTRRVEQAQSDLDEAMRERGLFREVEIEHRVLQGVAPEPFPGRLLLVIDRGCASACETSVLIARHLPGTLIVGENTNGTMKVGELRSYRLPRSGITVSAGHRVHEDPSREDIFPEGIGYQPDLWLRGEDVEARISELARCLSEPSCAARLDGALRSTP